MSDLNLHDPQLAELLEPTDEQVERIATRMRMRDRDVSRPSRRRRFRMSLVAACTGAAVLIAAIALSPGGGPAHDEQGAPTTARAALLAAAEAAGRATWRPLAPDEYHHVYFTSFSPDMPVVPGMDDRRMSGSWDLRPMATESWMRPDGRGLQIDVTGGGGHPNRYPQYSTDSRGAISGYGGTMDNGFEPVEDVEASLRYADALRTWRWMPGEKSPRDTFWVRGRSGYIRGTSWPGAGYPISGLDAAERAQVRYWGDTYQAISALDDMEGAELEQAVLDLLDGDPRDRTEQEMIGAPGTFGLTADKLRDEMRIRRAVKLLGGAPLAPRARRAIFEWLATQQHATLDDDATDDLGRSGTRVTFETVYDEVEPARELTLEALLEQAGAAYGRRPDDVDAAGLRDVVEHRAQRRWYVSIVFDTNSGELLEQAQYTGFRTDAAIPVLRPGDLPNRGPSDPWSVPWVVAWNKPYGVMTDSALYLTRERAAEIEPDVEACHEDPVPCR